MHSTKMIALFAVFLSVFIPNAADANQVVSFTLVNAATDADIGPLVSGDAVNLAVTGTNLNVRANVNGLVGSVRFGLDGSSSFRLESAAPYALAGDISGDYGSWTPALGSHSLTATPYSKTGGKGTVGIPLSIGFTVIDAPVGNRPPVLVSGPQASPNPVVLPAVAMVSVAASDTDGDALSYAWSQTAGAGAVSFVDATAASTGVSFSAAGSYTLQVTVSDGEATVSGSVNVSVLDDAVVVISGELKRWHKITLTLDGPYALETGNPNPFLDYRMDVVFSNGSLTYTVPGYFAADGDAANSSASQGNKWKAHLSPDLAGTWSYTISFKQGPNVATEGGGAALAPYDGLSGFFSVDETDKTGRDMRGKGRLRYVGKHHLQFTDTGEYFLKSGADSPENFLAYADFDNTPNNLGLRKTWEPHISDFRTGNPVWKDGLGKGIIGAVNYLSGKGMNALSFLTMSVQGDDRNVFMWVSPSDPMRYDCSKLDQWEIVLAHADTAGMFLHFKTQEYENDKLLDNGDLGTQRKLYYRELIARFGHHLALNWNLGEENQQTDAQRKAMSDYIRGLDPYDHLVVVHTEPDETDFVYTPLLGYPTFDGASLQSAEINTHSTTLYWIHQSATSGRPWVVTHDEMVEGVQPDGVDYWHDQERKEVLWGNFMAGGAGVEYYFGWNTPPYDDLTCQDYRTREHLWDLSRYALEFFIGNNIPFWEMTNSNDLTSNLDDYVLSKAGEVYVIYLKNGGASNLNLLNASGIFEVKWFDPQNGGGLLEGFVTQVSGGKEAFLGIPPHESDRDWVVMVRTRSGLEPDTEAPSVPQNLIAEAVSASLVQLSWSPSSDNIAVTGYDVLQDGVTVGAVAGTQFAHAVSGPNTSFTFNVRAFDGAGNRSGLSQPFVVTLPQPPNRAPVITAGPQAMPNLVTLPASTTVSVTATDADGDALSYAWSRVSGPGTATFANASAASSSVSFSAASSYMLQVVVSDGKASVSGSVSVTVLSSTQAQVVSFTLVNAATDLVIGPVANGDVVNLAVVGSSLNIRANTSGTVGSVRFALDGNTNYRTESAAPYALAGDSSGNYAVWTPALGSHSLRATPYSGAGGTGTAGIALSINFTVTNAATSNRAPVITAGPQATPNPVTLPATTTVSVTASDADGDALTYAWSKTAGPGTASFTNASAAATAVSFSAAGSYTLQVVVSDGKTTVSGSVNVSAIPPSSSGELLFSASFGSGSDQFTYSDDTFLGTSRPIYASGVYDAVGGFSGGGLRVTLGGVDANSITNGMSGGWSRSFNLAASAAVTISLRYRMQMNGGYEPDECSQVLLAVDGVLLGADQANYLYRDCGLGDGNPDRDSGWRQAVVQTTLPGGSHTLTVGGWNSQKTYQTEITAIYFDDISVNVDGATTVYFQDNFIAGTADNWQVIDEGGSSSNWQVIAGRLTQTRETVDGWQSGYHLGSLAVYKSGYALGDYAVQATVRALAPADGLRDAVGILFRYQNSDNYYRLVTSRMQGVSRLEKKQAGVFTTLAHDGQGFTVGQDLSIRIETKGSAIIVYINDLPRFGAVDSGLNAGTIALFTQGPAEFDNIVVSSVSTVPKVAVAAPIGDQVVITDALSGPYALPAAAVALNLPAGGGVRFTLDGNPATDKTDFSAPFEVVFTNVPAGPQHSVEATLVDSQNQPLDDPEGFDSDLKAGIGVGGRYLVGMGDSITNGVGDNLLSDNASADGRNLSRGYTPVLNNKITARLNRAVTVMNEGIGGATSAAGLSGFSGTLARHANSQIWMIVYGSNDAGASLPTLSGRTCSEADLAAQVAACRGTYKANLRQIILGLQQAGKTPALGLVPSQNNAPAGVDDLIHEYNQVLYDLVVEHGLQVLPPDFYGYFAVNPGQLVDGLHPSGSGYAAMAQMWYDALLNAGIVNP